MATTTMPIAAILLDREFFPRKGINEINVRKLVDALEQESPAELPPLLVSDPEHILVDGFHRHRAYEKVGITTVPVELKHYNSRADMLRDAITANVGRGQDLQPYDYARCLILCEQVGISDTELAGLLRVNTVRLDRIREQRIGRTLGHKKIALKRSLSHLIEHEITPEIERLNEHASGMQPVFHVDQLIAFLEAHALPDDDKLRTRLTRLGALIDDYLSEL